MLAKLKQQPLFAGAALVLLLSISIILAALGFEHIGGYKPCPLCLIERKAWYIGILAAALVLLLLRSGKRDVAKLILFAISLMFLINVGLAGYHAGIEWKWWAGPTSCTGDHLADLGGGAGGLLEALNQTKVIRCDVAEFRLFGLSFSGYNVLSSLLAAALAAFGLFASGRREHN